MGNEELDQVHAFDEEDEFSQKIVLRPQELSNHPGIIRRRGVVALNTALEMDIYGNMNSSHVMGTLIMNGVGAAENLPGTVICPFSCPPMWTTMSIPSRLW